MSTDTLTRDNLQQRQGGIWDYVSASRLALWAKCPLAFSFGTVTASRRRPVRACSSGTECTTVMCSSSLCGVERW